MARDVIKIEEKHINIYVYSTVAQHRPGKHEVVSLICLYKKSLPKHCPPEGLLLSSSLAQEGLAGVAPRVLVGLG